MNADHPDLVSGITTINPFANKIRHHQDERVGGRLMSDYNITGRVAQLPDARAAARSRRFACRRTCSTTTSDLDYVMDAIMALAPQIDV